MNYFLLYKPYGCLSQFTQEVAGQQTLADLFDWPKNVYAVGRLDKDSEGLLLLTDDRKVNKLLLNPKRGHTRTYWVQVEGTSSESQLSKLSAGLSIRINKRTHRSLPLKAKQLRHAPTLPARVPPIRFRKTVPDTWISLQMNEGKNRQVRRMCAAVGLPVLRLVRYAIEGVNIDGMQPGEVCELSKSAFYTQLKLAT